MDDILDFTASADALGKPACSDLKSGNLTAPALYALEEQPYLATLVDRELAEDGDLEKAIAIVESSEGISRAKALARSHADSAIAHLADLPQSDCRQTLIKIAEYTLSRAY